MANEQDKRPELSAVRVDGGWAVQALSHTGDSAWMETREALPYAMAMATILGMCATGEYVMWEPNQ